VKKILLGTFLLVALLGIFYCFLYFRKTNQITQPLELGDLSPQALNTDIIPDRDMISLGLQWQEIPTAQIITNKGVINWNSDKRAKCTDPDPKANSVCLKRQKSKYNTGSIDFLGREWKAIREVLKPKDELYPSVFFMNIDASWTPNEYKVDNTRSFTPLQGANSATYQPTCVYSFIKESIRVACITRIVDETSTQGEGLMVNYIYPYTEEFRFFLSDIIPFSEIASKIP
jgi:hypothetical protein